MNNIFLSLLKRIYLVQKLPIKRYSWNIEMKVLELEIELQELLDKYDKDEYNKIKNKNNLNLNFFFNKFKNNKDGLL